jgi:hypothetical protein
MSAFRKVSMVLAAIAATIGLSTSSAWATAIAHSDLTFHDLTIAPSAGSVQFTGPWILQAQASASNSLGQSAAPPLVQLDGPGTANTSAVVPWANANGIATDPAPTPPYLDVSGSAIANGNILGQVTGSAVAQGRGTVRRDRNDLPKSYFQIFGGTAQDTVSVTFNVLVDYGLKLQTDQYGVLAEAEAIFGQELFGQDVGLVFLNGLDQYWAIGPNDSYQDGATNLLLSTTVDLHYSTTYTLLNEGDAEIRVFNVPEPATLWLLALGLPLVPRMKSRRA